MSSNPFAALDDSGDEAPTKKVAPVSKKSSNKTTVPSSRPDPKSKPKNNDRNTKYGRGGRAPVRDGKRAYDRRSGTGRGKEIKKGGGGARNWGSDKNEAKKMEGRINEDEEIAPVDETQADVPVEKEEPAKEDNTMTFADYIASKGKKEEVQMRETKNDFAGATASKKGEEDSFMAMGGGKKKKGKKKKDTERKTIDVGFRVAKADENSGRSYGRGDGREDGRDSRGGRGDRRGGRGGRKGGRGSGRGPRNDVTKKSTSLNVADAGAFPSL